jgi:putative ABC transport system permease protein
MNELLELWREVWWHRTRLLPVVLGLCFGTLGLSVLLAFGDGFDEAVRASLARSGDHMLRWSAGATSLPFDGRPAGQPQRLELRQLHAVAAVPGVVAVSPHRSFFERMVSDSGRVTNASVAAVGSLWPEVRGCAVAPGGRFLSPLDEAERRRVAVIGATLARRLFDRDDVVGRSLRVFDRAFVVVGVLPATVQMMNYNGDDAERLFVPYATLQAMFGLRSVERILARIDAQTTPAAAEANQRSALARSLGCSPADRTAVNLVNHARKAGEIGAIVTGVRTFLFLVGLLGLLVAAVGVANMTFVLVEERIPELGLRQALGATPQQIRRRQLLETAVVVAVGGGLGLLLAALVLWGINQLPLDPMAKGYLGEPLLAPATALLIAGLLGLCAGVAGWYPAARAAAVQPMEALRHD